MVCSDLGRVYQIHEKPSGFSVFFFLVPEHLGDTSKSIVNLLALALNGIFPLLEYDHRF